MQPVENLSSTTVHVTPNKAGPAQPLSPIDLSPLLLKTVNCPALKFDYALNFARLQSAATALLLEYPVIGARVNKTVEPAPYCIDLSRTDSGIVLVEARTDAPSSAISLNGALATPFSMTSRKVQLPPWYQPLDMSRLLSGGEPLLKLQLTHCSDGGSILAATMPHLLVDSHSSTLLLTRLAQLYRSLSTDSHAAAEPPSATGANSLAAVADVPPDAEGEVAAGDAWAAGAVDAHRTVTGAWVKTALCADADAKDWQRPGTLKALSLELQSPEAASWVRALHWLSAAVKEGLAAARRSPGDTTSLTSCLLHIPKTDVQRLKAMAAANSSNGKDASYVSTNDAVSALVWLTFCGLRGRPLPGSSSSSSSETGTTGKALLSCFGCTSSGNSSAGDVGAPRGVLGLAVDLRQNCKDLTEQLPADYFGNAAWCLHILSPDPVVGSKQSSGSSSSSSLGGAAAGYIPALQAAAGAVRGALNSFRQTPESGTKLLQLIAAQQAAPTSVLVRNLSRLAVQVDAFITSWNFPIDDINFGGASAAEYACLVRPSPPWQAAVLPIRQGVKGEGEVQLLLTVPVSAVPALRSSSVLQQLVPNAVLTA